MPTLLLTLSLAQALAQAVPTTASTAAPSTESAAGNWRRQVFVSPAGEPFRVPEGQPYPVADWFAQADSNHDGKLSEAEFTADFLRFAATLDTNHDGILDGTEVEAYETRIVPEVHSGSYFSYATMTDPDGGGGETSRPTGPPADSQPMGAGKYGLINLPEPVAAMDTDLTGRINRREVAEAAVYRFSLLDPDQRGYLVLASLPETFAQGHRGKVNDKRRR